MGGYGLTAGVIATLVRVLDLGARGVGARISFAQEGEDLLIERLVEDRRPAVYVDVGAHHPLRFSNTLRLHLAGWAGINIDPTPGSMGPFRRFRRTDVNLEIAISPHDSTRLMYLFNEPALNTFSPEVVLDRERHGYTLVGQHNVICRPLRDVLAEHLRQREFGLLTIDTEGHDHDVLLSNEWDLYRPRLICVEKLSTSGNFSTDPTPDFLNSLGYNEVASTPNTRLFRDCRV